MSTSPSVPCTTASFWINQNLRISKKDWVLQYDMKRFCMTMANLILPSDHVKNNPNLSPCDYNMSDHLKEEYGVHKLHNDTTGELPPLFLFVDGMESYLYSRKNVL